ncbi:MAG TPA: UDP-2,3-diacylglucosamine diphosphatase LpxI [Myxococcota bacterium]|nr:UDP-2,3-diacylglucosamine diphosphatase LpxI [Myxococcota bacterium]
MEKPSPGEVLGLIAGQGVFPLEVARTARRRGVRVSCVALRDQTRPEIENAVESITWIYPGEVAAGLAAFRAAGVRDVVMAGKVSKSDLFQNPGALRLDADAADMIGDLADRKDDTILGKLADFLETLGLHLLPQYALTPELLAEAGVLTRAQPSQAQRADIAFGFPIAKTIGDLDIGQTIVVKDRAVLAVEAIEGTDAAIRRAGAIAAGACAVKVAKPGQDPRFDVPTIGPSTVAVLAEAKIAVLAIEAGATVVLEREAVVREADRHGIAIVAVAAGPPA